jgi:hypothetical protein
MKDEKDPSGSLLSFFILHPSSFVFYAFASEYRFSTAFQLTVFHQASR